MILSTGMNNLSFRSYEREEEMTYSDWDGMNSFGIGIYSEGHGLEPHLFVQPERNRLIIGFNSEISRKQGCWCVLGSRPWQPPAIMEKVLKTQVFLRLERTFSGMKQAV